MTLETAEKLLRAEVEAFERRMELSWTVTLVCFAVVAVCGLLAWVEWKMKGKSISEGIFGWIAILPTAIAGSFVLAMPIIYAESRSALLHFEVDPKSAAESYAEMRGWKIEGREEPSQ